MEEEENSCWCVFCFTIAFFVCFIGFQINHIFVLQVFALGVSVIVLAVCCVHTFESIRDQCLYWRFRRELYQIERRANVSIVPSIPRPPPVVIVIQNPNDISLGYISKDSSI